MLEGTRSNRRERDPGKTFVTGTCGSLWPPNQLPHLVKVRVFMHQSRSREDSPGAFLSGSTEMLLRNWFSNSEGHSSFSSLHGFG